MKPELKKLLVLNLPYLLFVYLFAKCGQAYRLAAGADASAKLLHLTSGTSAAFASPLPSLHPFDLCVGVVGAVAVRLIVYSKGKNAKKYRKGEEYGSARWGTAKDIAPYIDPKFENNILLTQTERLTMTGRPKDPKTARNKNVLVIGGSGSGKTTLACRLKALFGEDEVRLISHDSYYKRHDELPFEERCKLNYDHPDAFDNALLIYHLQELKAGRAIDCPVYDYADHNRSNEVQHIEPAPVLIVEGILPFVEPELCAMFDYKIFVDTDADERILRRLVRDVKERGRSLDSVINQYLTTVKPMHEAFVEPSKRNADIIVPNGGENTTAIEMLAHHIRSLIEKANML